MNNQYAYIIWYREDGRWYEDYTLNCTYSEMLDEKQAYAEKNDIDIKDVKAVQQY